jgi:hypothetical protein
VITFPWFAWRSERARQALEAAAAEQDHAEQDAARARLIASAPEYNWRGPDRPRYLRGLR